MRHRRAYPENPTERAHRRLETGGEYQWRREGEVHLFNPETVFLLQHATRSRQYDVFEQYTQTVDQLSEEAATLRGLFTLKTGVLDPQGKAIEGALRSLWIGTPANSDVWMSFVWVVVLTAIFAPLAVSRYRTVAAK